MHHPDADAPLFNALPPAVAVMAVLIAAAEAVFQLGEAGLIGGPGAVGWRLAMFERFGLVPGVFQVLWERGEILGPELVRLVTYPFLHMGVADALFSAAFVLAIGKAVSERLSQATFLAVFFVSAIATGVLAAGVLGPRSIIIGAWAPVSGLIGAFTWALWLQARATGANPWRAFALMAGLGAIQAFFSIAFGGLGLFEFVAGGVSGLATAALLHPAPGRGLRYWLDRARNRA